MGTIRRRPKGGTMGTAKESRFIQMYYNICKIEKAVILSA